jgi:predicted permease
VDDEAEMKAGYCVPRIALGACVGAALGAALEFALPALAHTQAEEGATASSIDTAALFLAGAGIGSAVGALLASVLHRSQPQDVRFESGVVAGSVGAAIALLPAIVYAADGDILVILIAFVASMFIVTVFALAGAGIGTLLASRRSMA